MKKPSMEQIENEAFEEGARYMKQKIVIALIEEIRKIKDDIVNGTIKKETGEIWISVIESDIEIIEEVEI